MTDQDQLAREIEAFVAEQFPTAGDLSREVDLFDAGVIDSIGVVELIAYVESRYAVALPDEALLSQEFGTIAGMARVVASLLAGQVPA